MVTTVSGIGVSIAGLLIAEAAPAFPTDGSRDAVESAVARFMTIVQNGRSDGAAVLDESIEGGAAIVRSRLVTRRGSEIPLDYRVHMLNGRWRIYDVVVQGISFIANYRTQFDRVIRAESNSACASVCRRRRRRPPPSAKPASALLRSRDS